jgi:hypothetical protein
MARDPRERRSAERAPGRGERAPPRQPDNQAGDHQDQKHPNPAELFAGGTPREVLGRLLDGDPLDIESHTRSRLKESALLLDIERWTLRSMARVAYEARRWDRTLALAQWIDGLVDRAARDLLDEDRAALRLHVEPAEQESRYAFLTKALGIEPRIALRACVAFNDLPPHVRRTFWALVVEGKSYARCTSEGLGSHEQIHDNMRRALSTLSQLADPDNAAPESGEQDA